MTADQAAQVVERFAAAWAHPSVDGFLALLTPDVRLRAPLVEPSDGLDGAAEEFARLLYVWPGVHGVVRRWSASDDAVFIEWTLQGDVAGRHVAFDIVDRLIVRDGLIAERDMFGDAMTLAAPFLRSPSQWIRVWRSGIAPMPWLRRLMRHSPGARKHWA